jgi:hypothetical protein
MFGKLLQVWGLAVWVLILHRTLSSCPGKADKDAFRQSTVYAVRWCQVAETNLQSCIELIDTTRENPCHSLALVFQTVLVTYSDLSSDSCVFLFTRTLTLLTFSIKALMKPPSLSSSISMSV